MEIKIKSTKENSITDKVSIPVSPKMKETLETLKLQKWDVNAMTRELFERIIEEAKKSGNLHAS